MAGLAIDRLISQAIVGVKGFAKLGWTTSLGLHSGRVRQGFIFDGQLLAKLDGSLVRQGNACRARCRTLNCCSGFTATAFNFRLPVFTLLSATLASGVPLSFCRK